jgi:hypothetical protein
MIAVAKVFYLWVETGSMFGPARIIANLAEPIYDS